MPAAAVLHRRLAQANYEPKTWDYDSICSMHLHGQNKVQPSKESSLFQLASLKQIVRQLLLLEEEEDGLPNKLRIIDQLQSLGVAYHFEEEIKSILTSMHVHDAHLQLEHDLSSTALLFKLLRAHGIPASTDMLSAFFTNDNGGLDAADNINLMRDDNDDTIDGLVALYEASYLAFPGEAMLNTARAFAIDRLQQQMMPSSMVGGSYFQEDLPLHWRAPRLQAIRSLKHHRSDCSGDEIASCIMQLAAEDFDRVQAVHQSELVELTRWWKETKLGEKLPLSARDRLVECFFCATCIAPEPRHAGCRDVLAKVGSLIVHLDDIYDVYGTIDELATFTDAIAGNWDDDDDATALLPEYMQAMLSVIRSTSMAAADRVLREHGHDVLPVYKKAWHELCEAFMVEAKWQHEKVIPGLDEYLENGWVTSTGPLLLLHALTMLPSSNQQEQQRVDSWLRDDGKVVYPRLVELCSRIFRLCNDCATHEAESERGEGPSSIACFMSESSGGGVSKEEACGAVADAIAVIWKEVNRELLTGSVDAGIMCVNLARVIQCIYHDGDGITSPTDSRKKLIKDLLFTPIRTLL